MLKLTLIPASHPSWRDDLGAHLCRLDDDSVMRRFGTRMRTHSLLSYAQTSKASWIVCLKDGSGVSRGFIEICPNMREPRRAEIGLSLEKECRGQGLGKRMLDKAIECCKNQDIRWIDIVLATHNPAMAGLAESSGTCFWTHLGDGMKQTSIDVFENCDG